MKKRKAEFLPRQLELFPFGEAETSGTALPSQNRFPVFFSFTQSSAGIVNTRFIELGNTRIEYEFRRTRRRSIGFLVNRQGLRITAPKWATIRSVEEAIREKERWVVLKLHQFLNFHEEQKALPQKLRDGIRLPYLGQDIVIRLQPGAAESITLNRATNELAITVIHTEDMADTEHRLKHWLKNEAWQIFSQRLPHYAKLLDVRYRSFSLSGARHRWGSCTASGNIRLNWRLVHFPPELVDYVICHELAHLREMNHSRRFWEIVAMVFPDYKAAKKQLHELGSKVFSFF